jgi:hypothetical protein
LYITVPNKSPDSINTVIVLQWKGELATHKTRMLAPNSVLDRLLAFDAKQEGKGFSYGDGKTDRYYVEGWKSKEQSLAWDFNTIKPGEYNIRIKYLAPAESAGGSYSLSFYKHTVETTTRAAYHEYKVDTTTRNTVVVIRDLDLVRLAAGSYSLVIDPVSIGGSELMKLLEVQLILVDKK